MNFRTVRINAPGSASPWKTTPESVAPPTPLEMHTAYLAGRVSWGQQTQCPYGDRAPRRDPTGILAAQWEKGREVMRRRELETKAPLLALAGEE